MKRGKPANYAVCEVDGVGVATSCVDDWTQASVDIVGAGEHSVVWAYAKTTTAVSDDDCAWLDEVVWTSAGASGVTVDVGGGKTLTVSQEWLTENTSRAATDEAANGRKVWECYVLGLDPEQADDFRITSMPMKADGTPDFANMTFEPAQSEWNVSGAVPKVMGAATLEGPWSEVPSGGDSAMRFFKVVVELP